MLVLSTKVEKVPLPGFIHPLTLPNDVMGDILESSDDGNSCMLLSDGIFRERKL